LDSRKGKQDCAQEGQDHGFLQWQARPVHEDAAGLAGGFGVTGWASGEEARFRANCGSMTRFVLIAADQVKDYFVHFSLFS
jgi:hypothetical protein